MYSNTERNVRDANEAIRYANLYRNAHHISFALSDYSRSVLEKAYHPVPIIPGTSVPPSGGHQIAAAHLQIAEKEIKQFIKSHESFIEIGPNAANFFQRAIGKQNAHGCTLRSARDQSRHLRSAYSRQVRMHNLSKEQIDKIARGGLTKEVLHNDIQMLASGITTETFCLNGWENCNHIANIGISVHSMYDISFRKLAIGMRNHNVKMIRAFMHFPVEALDVDKYTNYERGYSFIVKDGKIYQYWVDDPSEAYVHDQKTWLNYLIIGGFDTPFGFSVTIEKMYQFGSQFTLNISKTTAKGAQFYCIKSGLSELCMVPNFRILATQGFCKREMDVNDRSNYIITSREKVKRLLDYVNARAGKGFTLDTVHAYMRTLIAEIRLGGVLLEERWNLTPQEFADLSISIYLLSLYQRKLDSAVIDDARTQLDKLTVDAPNVKQVISNFLNDIINTLKPFHIHTKAKIYTDEKNVYSKFCIRFYEDHIYESKVKEHKYDDAVYFGELEDYPDVELTLNERAAQCSFPEKKVTPNAPDYESLNSDLGILEPPQKYNENYLEQRQHEILLEEIVKNMNDPATPKPLATTLKSAYSVLNVPPPKKLYIENMRGLVGVPGARKTGMLIEIIIPKLIQGKHGKVLVITPTMSLRDQYNEDLPAGSIAMTMHSALNKAVKENWDCYIIDEAFTFPIGYINFIASLGKTILVGDPNQIGHVDFSGMWKGCDNLKSYISYIPCKKLTESFRLPQDIVSTPFIKTLYNQITSNSKKLTSIEYVPSGFSTNNANYLTFTQDVKNQLKTIHNIEAKTVHEVQGKTFVNVFLYFNNTHAERELLKSSPNHLVVGLTRHTNKLYIRDSDDHFITTMINDTPVLGNIADKSNIDLNAVDINMDTNLNSKPLVLEQNSTNEIPYQYNKTDYMIADASISAYTMNIPQRENISTISTMLSTPREFVKLRLHRLGNEEEYDTKKHKVYRFPVPQRVMITKHHQSQMLLRTNLERLGKLTKNIKEKECDVLATKLFNNVEKEFNWDIKPMDHHQMFIDAIEKMNLRGQTLDNLMDAQTWHDQYIQIVKSHLKSQQKPMLEKDAHAENKAGQGISAWQKTLNLHMSCWTRLLEKILINHSKGSVHITSGMNDKEVMCLIESKIHKEHRFLENDWSQFDSNQNNVTRKILYYALKKIGCPDILLLPFMQQLKERRIVCETLSMIVHDKKDSGAPHTLIDNCLFNLAICLDITSNYDYIFIKGDDSLIVGVDPKFNESRREFYEKNCGYTLKPKSGITGSYVSFIVSTSGVAYDLVRQTAKILSRAYVNKEEYIKYQDSVLATYKVLNFDEAYNMCKVNSLHYTNSMRTIEHFDSMLSFIYRFANREIPFDNLVEHDSIFRKTDCPQLKKIVDKISVVKDE